MPPIQLSLAPGGIAVGYRTVSQDAIDAYLYTQTKAQMTARAVNPDPTSEPYYQAMVTAMAQLGWIEARANPFVHAAGGAPKTPLAVITEALIGFITEAIPSVSFNSAQIDGYLQDFYQALETAPAEVTANLDSLWSNTAVSVDTRVMTFGPLFEVLSAPTVATALISLKISGDSWRCLIEPSSDFELRAAPVAMALNMATYRGFEAGLKAELAADLTNRINTVDLDLGGCRLEAAQ